jgi:hypothetical protein
MVLRGPESVNMIMHHEVEDQLRARAFAIILQSW